MVGAVSVETGAHATGGNAPARSTQATDSVGAAPAGNGAALVDASYGANDSHAAGEHTAWPPAAREPPTSLPGRWRQLCARALRRSLRSGGLATGLPRVC